MDFQVRKGLETPLKVHGMSTKYFLVYCIILAVLVLFVVGFLTSAMSGEGSFFLFIVALMIGALLSVFLRVLLSTCQQSANSLNSEKRFSLSQTRTCCTASNLRAYENKGSTGLLYP